MKEIGSKLTGNSCTFTVWAPMRKRVDLRIIDPPEKLIPMSRDDGGCWTASVDGIRDGALYRYRLDNSVERADPASAFQPEGVHGPSMVVDHKRFSWNHPSPSTKLSDYIVYELHIGTFSNEGTFASAASRLGELSNLGINAVEVMPLAQFPGRRNWGYDGVYPFAVQNSYGGVDGFKSFIDEAHGKNLAVILDVVYNHLGPEGNYLRDFGPYFSRRYTTPWGESLNFDGAYSDRVCDFFIANALYWFREFHVDALRLDAVHAIYDMGARPFLQRLAETIQRESDKTGTKKYLIAESDLNDSRIMRDRDTGGFGMDAQWSDDFHHSLHTLLTGESRGYYADFGSIGHMVRALRESFCYSGEYSAARKRTHGNDVSDFHTGRFVVCSQNHDQVGNRMMGERLISITDFERAKLAAAAVLLSPYIPLLFMGEEHGEDNPFLYFADHSDKPLLEAVRKGRKAEFAEFRETGEPPDPFDPWTFERSKIDWDKRKKEPYSIMYRFYKELINLRRTHAAISPASRDRIKIVGYDDTQVVSIEYLHDTEPALVFFNFSGLAAEITPHARRKWKKVFDTKDDQRSANAMLMPADLTDSTNGLRIDAYQCAVYIGR